MKLTKETKWVKVGVRISNEDWWWDSNNPEYWLVENLKKGDIARNSFGEEVAKIVNVESFEGGAGGRRLVFLELEVNAKFDPKLGLYLYNSSPLEVGNGLDLTFGDNRVKGIITHLGDDDESNYLESEIVLQYKRIPKEIVDKLVNSEANVTDSSGKVVAEMIDLKVEPNYYNEFSDIRGKNIRVSDDDFRNLKMVVRLRVNKSGDKYYFIDGTSITIGNEIWLLFTDFFLEDGEIIDYKILE